ncbi:4-amino-4-deoxy-L-arabinose-phosphoundecaprenol flippase subunit ArnF [Pluralibacter sp.]|uniref:4-amino-4-deoxy-L-arabinose-phosphoundecaprenol flippase subunit ArnF n=1 Tax=Pluralibacter sp. TaxID=1920032 RepID=UPI0025DEBA0E|nr:4-amino-4-deoxy-L-arabinose-phosphoundecaprenol flippase subunit ArnF [Pluralibacter sp.]MBV8042764.1 4-amino-4-deoxy-L-arabinose-phospho-UDP flippase [Pluralibacter sp.]
MGFIWALLSVALTSAAQLILRSAMLQLPPVADLWAVLMHLLHGEAGTFSLFLGLCGYLASMVCWFFALKRLPLAKAYALLSLSYITVWVTALRLQNDAFSWQGLAGVLIIMAGVMVIFMPSGRAQPQSSHVKH